MARQLDVTEILAKNLKALLEDRPELKNNSALGRAAKVAPNSIANMKDPDRRVRINPDKVASPTLANVEKVAKVFGKEAWQLLHPNPDIAPLSQTERAMYERAMKSIKDIRDLTDPGSKVKK